MKKQFLYVLILIAIMITATSCKSDEDTGPEGPFKGGVAGVDIEFVEGAPLSTFDQGQDMEFKVRITNNGEQIIPAGEAKAQLFGISPSFGLNTNYIAGLNDLQGISKDIDFGGEQIIDLGIGNYGADVINQQDFDINARVCYPYMTKVSTTVCMGSRRIEESGEDSACTIQGSKLGKDTVSAAPIQVTKIEESYKGSDGIRFEITVENKDTGKVYDNAIACENLNALTDMDVIYVDIYPHDLICIFPEGSQGDTGKITLNGGMKTFVCEKTIGSSAGSNYKENLKIDLTYKYMDKVSKTVTLYGTS